MPTGLSRLHAPNSPSGVAVVLIHGFGSSYERSFVKQGRNVAQAIAARYDYSSHCEPHIFRFDFKSHYPGYGPSFSEIASVLATGLDKHKTLSTCHCVVLVGNSAGGIIVGELLRQSEEFSAVAARIKGVVTLGTPFAGVPGFWPNVFLCLAACLPGCRQARELLPWSRLLRRVSKYWRANAWGKRHDLLQAHYVECEGLPLEIRVASGDSIKRIGGAPNRTHFVGTHHLKLTEIRASTDKESALDIGPPLDRVIWDILVQLDNVGRPQRPYRPTIQEETLLGIRRGANLDKGRGHPVIRLFDESTAEDQAVEALDRMEPAVHRYIAAASANCMGCGGGLKRALYFQPVLDAAVRHHRELNIEPDTACDIHISRAAALANVGDLNGAAHTLSLLRARGLVQRDDAQTDYRIQAMSAHISGTRADVGALGEYAVRAYGTSSSQIAEALCCRVCTGIRLGAPETPDWIAAAETASSKVSDETHRQRLCFKVRRLQLMHQATTEVRERGRFSTDIANQVRNFVIAAGAKNRQFAAWGAHRLHQLTGEAQYGRIMAHYVDEMGEKRFDCALDLTDVFSAMHRVTQEQFQQPPNNGQFA